MKAVIFSLCTVSVITLSLNGCADTKEALGMTSNPPDEFAVVDNPPLSMPPDFALQPPRPGLENAKGNNPSEKAAKALFSDGTMELVPQKGVSSLKSQNLSAGEQVLISQSGSDKANPTIRSQLEAEKEVASPKLIDQLLFWKKPKEPGAIVDPTAEAARIDAAKQKGLPVTTGPTTAYDRGKQTEVQ